MENHEWKWVYISLLSAVIFFILMFVAGGMMDCMSGGCAVSFISFFLVICSFGVALLFFTRARVMDDILGGKNLLAHWVYPADETQKSAEREYANYRESNKAMLLIVGGFLVLGMIFMVILGGDAGIATAEILFIVLIIIAVVSVVAPKLELKRALNASHEAYISDAGIIYEGAVYPFHSFLVRMDGVSFVKETGKRPPLLVFSFIQLVGIIIRPFEISIPVPSGEEENARGVARRLGGKVPEEETIASPGSICTACGAAIKQGDDHCEACGVNAESGQLDGVAFAICPGCGIKVKPGVNFCRSCGYKLQ